MAKRPKPAREKIIGAALSCAAAQRWNSVTLTQIADEAGVSLSQLHEVFPSRTALLRGIMDSVTQSVVADGDPSDMGEPPHDRLLDALMRRFDALEPHKQAMGSILGALRFDPAQSVRLFPGLMGSMSWTLESAGISSAGIHGALRTKGLAAIYLAALQVWLRDETEDQSKTLAFLDRRLRQAAQVASFIPGLVSAAPPKDGPSDG